jgi:hypothetical protein
MRKIYEIVVRWVVCTRTTTAWKLTILVSLLAHVQAESLLTMAGLQLFSTGDLVSYPRYPNVNHTFAHNSRELG